MHDRDAPRIVRLSVVLLAVLLSMGATPASEGLDWQGLGAAFAAFVSDPTEERAAAVVAFLPAGSRPAHRTNEEDQKVRDELEEGTRTIQELVERGSLPALRVAFALYPLSDGDWAEWLSYIRGAGAVFHPREYLQWAADEPSCPLEILLISWQLRSDHRPVLEARIRALESVAVPELATAKACSLRLLRSGLDEPALQ